MKNRVLSILLLISMLLLVTGCLGPKPVLRSFTSEPPQPGSDQPFKVEAVISNAGPGGGQVEVVVTLTNKQSGEIIRKDTQNIDLQKDETQHVLFEMDLSSSAKKLDPQNIKVDVDAHYPIE